MYTKLEFVFKITNKHLRSRVLELRKKKYRVLEIRVTFVPNLSLTSTRYWCGPVGDVEMWSLAAIFQMSSNCRTLSQLYSVTITNNHFGFYFLVFFLMFMHAYSLKFSFGALIINWWKDITRKPSPRNVGD